MEMGGGGGAGAEVGWLVVGGGKQLKSKMVVQSPPGCKSFHKHFYKTPPFGLGDQTQRNLQKKKKIDREYTKGGNKRLLNPADKILICPVMLAKHPEVACKLLFSA